VAVGDRAIGGEPRREGATPVPIALQQQPAHGLLPPRSRGATSQRGGAAQAHPWHPCQLPSVLDSSLDTSVKGN
jgi:hypothetical protein